MGLNCPVPQSAQTTSIVTLSSAFFGICNRIPVIRCRHCNAGCVDRMRFANNLSPALSPFLWKVHSYNSQPASFCSIQIGSRWT
jgi:hypothetical protein